MKNIQERSGRFQLRVKHKLLKKPWFFTFDSEDEATAYGEQLKRLLNAGVVPAHLVDHDAPSDPLLIIVIREYSKSAPITDSDSKLLDAIAYGFAGLRVSAITARWVDEYVRLRKTVDNNAPSTIRKKVGVLARVIDWHFRRVSPDATNPLRKLPRGYSGYSKEDAAKLDRVKGQTVKRDIVRDRRLLPAESVRVRTILAEGHNLNTNKAVIARPELLVLFDLIADTGLRLSEAYSLRVDQLELDRGFTNVDGSKGHREVIKPRIVPLKPHLVKQLRAWADKKTGLLFSYWDGTRPGKKTATRDLVQLFGRLFGYAKLEDFTEHDLRHEACCRWFELRGKDGRWVFSDVEICRIMGWSNYSMILRYASLRGEDLSARLL